MKPINSLPKDFDYEIAVRNAAYGAAIGFVFGPKVGLDPNSPVGTLAGAVIASAIDRGIFWIKRQLKIRK